MPFVAHPVPKERDSLVGSETRVFSTDSSNPIASCRCAASAVFSSSACSRVSATRTMKWSRRLASCRYRHFSNRTGSPGAVARPRFPQNVACGFPAPRSSTGGSQHCEGLQLSVRKSQFWTQQRTSLLDLAEDLPGETLAVPAAALQHLAPVALHGSVNLEQ